MHSYSKWITLFAVSVLATALRAADLQQQIDNAISSGQKELIIAPGIYRLPARPHQAQLNITGARNMTIVADGVTVVATSLERAVKLADCRNVEVRGLRVDYDPLPYTQGVITALGADGKSMDVSIDTGYPSAVADSRKRVIIHDAVTCGVKEGTATRFGVSVTPGEKCTARFSWAEPVRDSAVVGDRFSITQVVQTPHGVVVDNCTDCTLRNVTVFSGTSFGIFEYSGGGNRYISCKIIPGDPPAGATARRLLSSKADGFHSRGAVRGPLVENCQFEGMGDDGIAIHGDYLLVTAVRENVLIVSPQQEFPFFTGDRVHGVSLKGQSTRDSRIVNIRPLAAGDIPDARQIQLQYYPQLRLVESAFRQSYEVTLDSALPVEAGYLLASPDRNGSGFILRGNIIRNTRARGMLVKASYGLIENNTVEHIALGGIVLCPETYYWHEADFSRDVAIRGNTVRKAQIGFVDPFKLQAGAITVCSDGDGHKPGPAGGHHNIVIENNVIDQCVGTNIMVTSATDVKVARNVFVKPFQIPGGNGGNFGVDPGALIWITQSEDVHIDDNVVRDAGSHFKTMFINR